MMPHDSYAYVEAALQPPPSPDYDDVLIADEQPLPAAVSLTADSPGYIHEFYHEEDPEEDDEEDPADYPTNREDDDKEEESSRDEADDEDEDDDEDKEEEEHPALANSIPPLVHHVTARMSVQAQTPISLPLETEVSRLLAIPTLPPSPLSPLSSPLPPILSPLPHILSPPLHISPPPLPASPTYPLGYRAAMIRLRAESPSTSYPPPPIVLPKPGHLWPLELLGIALVAVVGELVISQMVVSSSCRGPSRLCAPIQREDDKLFRIPAYMEYIQLEFCKRYEMPIERHRACPIRMHDSHLLPFPGTAPLAKSLASHISSKGISQFRAIKIGASHSFVLSVLNASTHFGEKMIGASFSRSQAVTIDFEVWPVWLCQLDGAVGKDMRNGKRTRPAAFQFARKYLKSGVKKEDPVTNVENTVLNFRVIKRF
nr:hypothetical protein [Tanacetum cinerariifolium]